MDGMQFSSNDIMTRKEHRFKLNRGVLVTINMLLKILTTPFKLLSLSMPLHTGRLHLLSQMTQLLCTSKEKSRH
eukprot:6044205-Ditylum_brightwellii.AAC.1